MKRSDALRKVRTICERLDQIDLATAITANTQAVTLAHNATARCTSAQRVC